jgi:SAM-dependent methyltransferase
VAVLYDWECRHVLKRSNQDVDFWRGVAAARSGAPVLELACGTGRLTLPLAATAAAAAAATTTAASEVATAEEAGVTIVGLDNNRAMLAAARRHAHHRPDLACRPPLFVAADMRRFALAARFGLVFVGYNSLQLLTGPGDMVACLTSARQHLRPDGRVGVEVTDFQVGGAGDASGGPDGAAGEDDWLPLGAAEGIRLDGTLVHNFRERTSRYRRRFSGEGWTVEDEVVVRSLDRRELGAVLYDAGLVGVEWFGEGPTIRTLAIRR